MTAAQARVGAAEGSRSPRPATSRGADGQRQALETPRIDAEASAGAHRDRGEGRGTQGQQAASGQGGGTDRAAADARTWTIELPAGIQLLSLNDRKHWREKHRIGTGIKDAALVMARAAKVPRLERAFIVVEYQPPDKRHRDADNPIASAKPAIDGVVQAGCLIDDECPKYVVGVYCTIGPQHPRGRLVLRITEAPAAAMP